jgi:hypothetical protein
MFALIAILIIGIELFDIDLSRYIFVLLWPLSITAMILSARHIFFSEPDEKKTEKQDSESEI